MPISVGTLVGIFLNKRLTFLLYHRHYLLRLDITLSLIPQHYYKLNFLST